MSNKIYTAFETDISFKPSAGGQICGFSPMSLPVGSGRISHPRDFGLASRPTLYRYRASTSLANSGLAGQTVEMFWCGFDSASLVDANMGSGDFMFNLPDKKYNLQWVGAISVDNPGGTGLMVKSGFFEVTSRYGSVVWFNATSGILSAGSGNHTFVITPFVSEIQ